MSAAELWRIAWPAILRNSLNCGSDRLTLALVGHYDPDKAHYDGAGLGKMYSNITGLSVGFGLVLGLATLCSQAHGAGRAAELNAIYFWRCAALLTVALGYSTAAAIFCERILTALAQPPRVAHCSALYAQVQLVGVPFFWAAQAVQTVCDGLQDPTPGLHANLVSAVAQVVMCVLFVHPQLLNWGYLGMAAARSAGGVVQLAVVCAVVLRQRRQGQVWTRSLSPQPRGTERVLSCRGVCHFLRVALPSGLMMWIEWWSFEALSLIVGLLPDATTLLAAHATLFNVLVTAYMAFTGLNTALCATTGKYIGAGQSGRAVPRLIAIALALALTFALAIGTAFYVLREPLARLFSADGAVVRAIDQNILGLVLSVVGATGSTIVSYILPGLCYWRLCPNPRDPLRLCALALLVFGGGVMVLSLALIASR